MGRLDLEILNLDGRRTQTTLAIEQILLAGYTGRDRASVREHIAELESLGVMPPTRVPVVFEVAPEMLSTRQRVLVRTATTSGEAEFFLVHSDDGILVGVGSDHTDRALEAQDIVASKRACPKIASRTAWRIAEVEEHWDRLILRSWVTDGEGRRLYQEARLGVLMGLGDLIRELAGLGYTDLRGRIVFGGTVPTLGGLVYARHFDVELADPVNGRSIACGYDIVVA